MRRTEPADTFLRLNFLLFVGAALFLCIPPLKAESGRWAVVAGSNYGGSERVPLRYAEDDARKMVRVLRELGFFPETQIRILLDSTPADMLGAIRRASPGERGDLLVVYYSGHADGDGLLMGDERLGLAELKQAVSTANADVALIILDACNAGAAIQTKGGRSAPSFIRFTDARRAKGRVILTSASASELAQESDEIGSSVFTHYLVSGLRGAADRSGDRRISLEELYRYVYDRTVHRTVDTLPGVQHPSFSYDLKGEGSIVLTDLNSESNGIILSAESAGDYLIFDRDRRTVVAELEKTPGESRLIPLSPGDYTLKKRLHDRLLVAQVEVKTGQRIEVQDAGMQEVDFEHPTAKGWDLMLRSRPSRWEAQALAGWTAFLSAPAGGIWSAPLAGAGLRLRGWPARHWAARLSMTAGAWEHENPVGDRRIPYTLVMFNTGFSVGRMLEYGPYLAEAGARATFVFLQRRFDNAGLVYTDQTPGGGGGAYALASVQLGRFRIAVEVSGGLHVFPAADTVAVPYFSGGMVLGLGL